MLSPEEIQRYKRHLVLKEIGGQGQQRLKAARVLVVGAGGLGSPLILYLAAAGVGTLGIIDDDEVSLDNLQRQVAHDTAHVGMAKVESARETVQRLNPHVRVETYAERLTAANALEIIGRYDIVADGSDNFATRYLVSDACYFAKKPLVFAAVGPFDGYVTVFKPHEKRSQMAFSIPVTGVSFPRHRRRGQWRIAPRSACSELSWGSSGPCKPSR